MILYNKRTIYRVSQLTVEWLVYGKLMQISKKKLQNMMFKLGDICTCAL